MYSCRVDLQIVTLSPDILNNHHLIENLNSEALDAVTALINNTFMLSAYIVTASLFCTSLTLRVYNGFVYLIRVEFDYINVSCVSWRPIMLFKVMDA